MTKLVEFLLIVVLGTALLCMAVGLVRVAMRWVRNRPPGAGAFAWALMHARAGDVPPPTPQEQAEQENSEKKNREAGEGGSKD
ncbi:MAG: hypothetical protein H7Y02_11030 [Candidatus Obscuribacterales bacterium]|nr:hypothetical protein [Steroidobacteraceae bacterium]